MIGKCSVASPWRLREVTVGEWWAIEDDSGTALRIEPGLAESMWRDHRLLDRSLSAALRHNHADDPQEAFVDLQVLGVTTRYESDDAEAVEHLGRLFAAARTPLRSTPDIVVRLSRGVDLERIHRTVSGPREGVAMGPAGAPLFSPVSSDLPAFPPLQMKPFSGRYSAVHSAFLAFRAFNALICGRRRAGKTTSCVVAEQEKLAHVLTDELALIDGTGKACGIPLPIRQRGEITRTARPVSVSERTGELLPVGHVVSLNPVEGDPEFVRIDEFSERLSALVPHLRVLDTTMGTATSHLVALAQRATVWRWNVRPWPYLAQDLEDGLRLLAKVTDE
jgi:hypothetical protein